MPFLRSSFRTRLAFWYTLLLTITVLVFGVVIVVVSRVSVLNTIDRVLEDVGAGVTDAIRLSDPADESAPVMFSLVSNRAMNVPGVWVQIWQTADASGSIAPRLLDASDTLDAPDVALEPHTLMSSVPRYTTIDIGDSAQRVLTQPILRQGQLFGVVQIATFSQYFEQGQQALPAIILIAAVVSILVSLISAAVLAERAIRPIEQITTAASHIVDARDLSTRLTIDDTDEELRQLVLMFNRMMERLEHLFDVQQRFIGDVSHEMRTPLTSIIGHLELMQRYGVDAESLQAVHREAERLSRTVSELLLLVRAESNEVTVEMTPIDLDRLILDVYEQAHRLTHNRTLRLILARVEPVCVQGNHERLRQLLMNLITNAIKFTPDHGVIRLSLIRQQDTAILEVADTGIGITLHDQKHIFDRFFQADQSRFHQTENDGAGLGLSIAKWVVDIHHGTIVVASTPGQGTTFRVTLPALPAPTHDPLHDSAEWPLLHSPSKP